MRRLAKAIFATAGLVACMVLVSPHTSAQKLPKSVYYQAQAMGQAQQLGRTYGITLIIEEYSTPDDQKALLTAFNEKQNEGLVNALSKMSTKGRLSITGTLGYDVTYIKTFPMPDGSTRIRLVTNRPDQIRRSMER
jgi:pyrroline-5-carboxylate reductase